MQGAELQTRTLSFAVKIFLHYSKELTMDFEKGGCISIFEFRSKIFFSMINRQFSRRCLVIVENNPDKSGFWCVAKIIIYIT